MPRTLTFTLAACLAVVPATGSAQERLTVDRAVREALAQNASLHAARAGVDEASARLAESRAGLFPRVHVTESWQRGNQPVFVFGSLLSARRFTAENFAIDALNHPASTGFFRTAVTVEHLAFDGGGQRAMSAAASRQRDAAQAAADAAAAVVAVATTETFGRVAAAAAARRATDAALASAREDRARAERRRDAGIATEADVLALVVHIADLEQRAAHLDAEAAAARAALNRLMGRPPIDAVDVAEPATTPPGEFGDRSTLPALLAEAEGAHPDVKRSTATAAAADAVLRQTRAALLPQVALLGTVDVSGTRFGERVSSWIVGAEVRWTFSTAGGEIAARNAAAAGRARAAAEARDARAAVHVDVIGQFGRLEAAIAREAAGRAAIAQARESQRIIRDRFDAGLAPVNDVLRAASALLDAEHNRISAAIDTMVATAMLRRALGRTP